MSSDVTEYPVFKKSLDVKGWKIPGKKSRDSKIPGQKKHLSMSIHSFSVKGNGNIFVVEISSINGQFSLLHTAPM